MDLEGNYCKGERKLYEERKRRRGRSRETAANREEL